MRADVLFVGGPAAGRREHVDVDAGPIRMVDEMPPLPTFGSPDWARLGAEVAFTRHHYRLRTLFGTWFAVHLGPGPEMSDFQLVQALRDAHPTPSQAEHLKEYRIS